MPKLITIAVSASAWGSGSAIVVALGEARR